MITPFSSTVATFSFEDAYVTAVFVASAGTNESFACAVARTATSNCAGVARICASALTTVTLTVADFLDPSVVVAVIVAVPALTAVTLPVVSTVATDSSEDV